MTYAYISFHESARRVCFSLSLYLSLSRSNHLPLLSAPRKGPALGLLFAGCALLLGIALVPAYLAAAALLDGLALPHRHLVRGRGGVSVGDRVGVRATVTVRVRVRVATPPSWPLCRPSTAARPSSS